MLFAGKVRMKDTLRLEKYLITLVPIGTILL